MDKPRTSVTLEYHYCRQILTFFLSYCRYDCRLVSTEDISILDTVLTEVTEGCPSNGSNMLIRQLDNLTTTDSIDMVRYRTQDITLADIDVSAVTEALPVACGGFHTGVSTSMSLSIGRVISCLQPEWHLFCRMRKLTYSRNSKVTYVNSI